MLTAQYRDLENKKILVTGASRGIGKAIATLLAKQKAHVLFNYRGSADQAQNLTQELESFGGKVTALPFDITHYDQMSSVLNEYMKTSGPIEALVNNAGISKDQLILRIKPEDLSQVIDTNLKAAILLTSILSRGFLKAENVSIVNISSIVGLMGNPSQAAYSASKAGLLGFTKSCAKELAPKNIRCNAICPGFITTEMTDALSEDAKKYYLESIPLGKMGNAQDVAELTCFLISKASSYITGEIIKIDGGLYI
ncbi:MAG: 3-oxoacyl-ACP reductase FabG [Bacteriovoracaceae bacterium]|nr:3-oxoacyl-ACP reductase FabG [Bacteriovoracaceae bacterium]